MEQTVIKLPPGQSRGNVSLEEAIARRRSVRRYRTESLDLSQLSQILWSAQGITRGQHFRAVPSAGATYPLELFVLVGQKTVNQLEAGIYRYLADSHSLRLHRQGDFRLDLAAAALGQEFIAEAPADIVICAAYDRTCRRYSSRGERYVHMEVGHAGQNIHLQAVALGLASVEVGAFQDEDVSKVLGAEEQIKPLYVMPVGKAA